MKELLSPAGDFSTLKIAVHSLCDAVYLGGKKFGARAFASNFSEEEMLEAISFCHLYGVKIYVTINTMIYEREFNEVIAYIRFLYENHVDAIIVSDLGIMKLVKEMMPEMEVHVSTQAHTHNVEQISFLKRLGVKRVVLARELSLEEIKRFPSDLELEVFIHGALCISYSGQCLFSSFLFDRSGNRGECAQICRLPFQLLKNGMPIPTKGQYLLSTKDLNTSTYFAELMDSPITSFKIEGRMKSPAYVGFLTKMYRNLMDEYEKTGTCQVSSNTLKKASLLFSRGFTEGKLNGKENEAFMGQEHSNHQGIFLGTILDIQKKKIKILLKEDLMQGDGIRFPKENKGMIVNFLYDEKGLLIHKAVAGDIIFIDNKVSIVKETMVMKTLDYDLVKSFETMEEKKILVSGKAIISVPTFTFVLKDGEHLVSVKEDIVSFAKNAPLTKDQVLSQLNRFGNTPFQLQEMEVFMDENLFVPVKRMNEIRRRAIQCLIEERIKRKDVVFKEYKRSIPNLDQSILIFASVRNEEQLKTLLALPVAGIYVSDYSLYQKYHDERLIYRTNRVNHKIMKKDVSKVLVSESGSLEVYQKDAILYADYFFNVSNHASVDVLLESGVKQIALSVEMKSADLEALMLKYPNGNPFEIIVYGRLPVMVLNHCILKQNVNQESICKVCTSSDSYALQDRNGEIYPIVMDSNHCTHLFHYKVMNRLQEVSILKQLGICKYRLEFFDESVEEIIQIFSELKSILQV